MIDKKTNINRKNTLNTQSKVLLHTFKFYKKFYVFNLAKLN